MALSCLLTLLLLFLVSVYSDPSKCADIQEIAFSRVNFMETLGKWNLIAGAYINDNVVAQDKQMEFAWIKISSVDGMANYTYGYAQSGSVITGNMNNLEVSEGPDGLNFKAQNYSVLTVKGNMSKDCIVMTVPGTEGTGILLTCKSRKAPKSVVRNFIRYATCQNYNSTSVRENLINYVLICEEILKEDPRIDHNKITGRWILVARASSSPRSPERDENHVDGWIEINAHGSRDVTVTRSPNMTDVADITEGKYVGSETVIAQVTDEGIKLIRVYETCSDELLLHVTQMKKGPSISNLFLFSKNGMIQTVEKKTFKNQALCSLHPYVYGIPAEQLNERSVSTCDRILGKDHIIDKSKILGRWKLVAKATNYDRCPCIHPDELEGWIEFTLHDGKVNVTRSPDSDMEEVPVESHYNYAKNMMVVLTGEGIVLLAPYMTCPGDFLILRLTKGLPLRITEMLLSRTGTAPVYIKEKFKAWALCNSHQNIYGIPDDL